MDNYPNLTNHEKSADARELRRALDEARAEVETWRMLKTPNRKAHHGLLEKTIWMLADARRWAAAWKRAAKFWRNTALGQRESLHIKIKRQAKVITKLLKSRESRRQHIADTHAERDALRAAVERSLKDGYGCPFCKHGGGMYCDGEYWHGKDCPYDAADCQRQRALGLGE